jgi:hypothetical protein
MTSAIHTASVTKSTTQDLPRIVTVTQPVQKFLVSMRAEMSLPSTQTSATEAYIEPAE